MSFCVAQMPTHKNVVKYYHLDKVKVAEVDYYVIIMKRYARSVKKIMQIKSQLKSTMTQCVNFYGSL